MERDSRTGAAPRHFWRQCGGNAALEAALIAPVLVLLAIGVADYGLSIQKKMQVQNAAQAGAEYAMRNGFDAAAIATTVAAATAAADIAATPAPVESCGCASGNMIAPATCGTPCADGSTAGVYVRVSAQGVYNTLIPYPGMAESFTFSATTLARTR